MKHGIVGKAGKWFYFLKALKRADVPRDQWLKWSCEAGGGSPDEPG